MLDHVRRTVSSASALPPTLVIHHRRDDCHVTHYDMVQPFMAWASGRARLVWIDGGFVDTEIGGFIKPEVANGKTTVRT